MEWFVKRFMKASVTWLALGVTLGVAMAVHPPWTVLRPVHMGRLAEAVGGMAVTGTSLARNLAFDGMSASRHRPSGA